MPKFWIAVCRPEGFDHAAVLDAAARAEIDALNDEMEAAGVRLFVGGLRHPGEAWTLAAGQGEEPGDALAGEAYLDGFWILEALDLDAALAWGRKATRACRAQVVVRPFHG